MNENNNNYTVLNATLKSEDQISLYLTVRSELLVEFPQLDVPILVCGGNIFYLFIIMPSWVLRT